jgi:UDP-3-O-[3-hydroxymyristoyl] glucosamine N-acyltransferase
MPTTLAALAQLVGGTVVGDGSVEIAGAATLDDATQHDITLFDRLPKAKLLATLASRAVVLPRDFPLEGLSKPALLVDDAHAAFAAIVTHFRPPRVRPRIGASPHAWIDPAARLAADVDVHPGATIEADVEIGSGSTIHSGARIMAGCKLGQNVTVFPNAVLYENTVVGDRSIVHAGAVLGCHGFGYRFVEGTHAPTAQLGWVEIGRDVEIGAGSTVDRGTYGPTVIQDGTKIDNLVMIAHNCHLGKHNMICSQVGIAGSTSTGDYVVMAGQVGVRDHVHIGTGAVLGAMAGVSNDVKPGARMFGIPATPEREQKLLFATISKLPQMRKQLRALQQRVNELDRDDDSSTASQHAA